MRFPELDMLRGIAVVMMVAYHFVFDLYHFAGVDIDPNRGFLLVFARVTASIFILLVGVGLSLSYSKVISNVITHSVLKTYCHSERSPAAGRSEESRQVRYRLSTDPHGIPSTGSGQALHSAPRGLGAPFRMTLSECLLSSPFSKFALRGLKTIILGLLITLVTYIYLDNRGTIWFGILHFMGLSIILSYPFLRLQKAIPPIALGIIIIGFLIKNIVTNSPALIIFGITTPNFYSLDYFPLFPWFGMILLGIFFGKIFYRDGKRIFTLDKFDGIMDSNKLVKKLSFLGQHSLIIYLMHQPILIGLINIFWLK